MTDSEKCQGRPEKPFVVIHFGEWWSSHKTLEDALAQAREVSDEDFKAMVFEVANVWTLESEEAPK